MHALARVLSVAVLLTAGVGLPGNPTAANGPDGTISARDGVLWEGLACDTHPVRYQFPAEPGFDDYTLIVEFEGPDGLSAGGDYLTVSRNSGTAEPGFCSDMTGRHVVHVTAQACDFDYNCLDYDLGSATFNMRLPKSRTTLRASNNNPTPGQRVTLRARVMDERPNGYFLDDYGDIHLEKRVNGRWKRVPGSKGYMGFGTYSWTVKYQGGRTAYRAVAHRESDRLGSKSSAIVVR